MKYLKFNNISTILTSILLTVFGLIIGYATSKGLNLPFDAETATTITMGVILFVFSYFNAKNPNDLFNEEEDTIYIPVNNLNDEQITLINNFIDKIVDENIIDDLDPAGEYDGRV